MAVGPSRHNTLAACGLTFLLQCRLNGNRTSASFPQVVAVNFRSLGRRDGRTPRHWFAQQILAVNEMLKLFRPYIDSILNRFVSKGSLTITLPDGSVLRGGDGSAPEVAIRFTDMRAVFATLIDPELRLGEMMMQGRLVFDKGRIYDLFTLILQDFQAKRDEVPGQIFTRIRRFISHYTSSNPVERSQANVQHHYDLSSALYDMFLDADKQYSCAYFPDPGATLEQAQLAKKRHIAAKLLVEPKHNVLDIGCGWGGLGLYLAQVAGAGRVDGITLSSEQLTIARQRAEKAGLADRVNFKIEDYRLTQGRYDRIVSVGMFEHVGLGDYDAFFGKAASLLADDGVMLLHTIGRTGKPDIAGPWLNKYIFPGGELPALSQITPALERSGLVVSDIEVLRLHYAETLLEWRIRFMAHWDEAEQQFGVEFCRMWEFYLAMAEAGFRFQDLVVYQFQLAKKNNTVPLTRDYIAREEARLQALESAPSSAGQAAG